MLSTIELRPGAVFQHLLHGWRLEIGDDYTAHAFRVGPNKKEPVSLEEIMSPRMAFLVLEVLAQGKAEAERR
jgi:hypothetical protein